HAGIAVCHRHGAAFVAGGDVWHPQLVDHVGHELQVAIAHKAKGLLDPQSEQGLADGFVEQHTGLHKRFKSWICKNVCRQRRCRTTVLVRSPREENMYGIRARIGYTSPPLVTEVFPYEFYKMAPAGVTLALTTMMVARHTAESGEAEESWNHAVRAAHAMAEAGVSMIVHGGTPV